MVIAESDLAKLAGDDAKAAPLPPTDTILQVRSGKIRSLGTAGLRSGIFKYPHDGKVFISKVGIVGDEVEYEEHGGTEKALHQYSAAHYAEWQREKPDKAHLFIPGGFGENLVSSGLNEDNVCMGDVYGIGSKVRIAVTGPRLPCFKLQHRFEWDKTPMRCQETNRTGWYYCVLRTGNIEAGDEMVLIDRPYPTWSIARVLDVMFRDKKPALYREILNLTPLGSDIVQIMKDRLNKGVEDMSGRLNAVPLDWTPYRLITKTVLTPRIKKFVFARDCDDPNQTEPRFSKFPFVRLRFGPDHCYDRAYSVVHGHENEIELGIALDRESRGGSRFLHESLGLGDSVSIAIGKTMGDGADVRELGEARHRIFIIGGVGITAFVGEIRQLVSRNASFEVHYACASREEVAYNESLPADKTTYYAKDRGQRLNVADVIPYPDLKAEPSNAVILCCGPPALLLACKKRTDQVGYPEALQHYESFGGDAGGDPFEVELSSNGRILQVPSNKTLLEVLEAAGVPPTSSCQVGNCGMCKVDYKSGEIQHRGAALMSQQKGISMLSCVSRGQGRIVLNL